MLNKEKNIELKIRVLKMEIKEAKKEMNKDYDMMWYWIIAFIVSIIAFPYFYFVRQEKELWKVISFIIMLFVCPFFSFCCYKLAKKKKKKKTDREIRERIKEAGRRVKGKGWIDFLYRTKIRAE